MKTPLKTNPHLSKHSIAKKNLTNLIADLDREDLCTLLMELAQRHAELYDWLEAALSVPTRSRKTKTSRRKKVDADVCRRQVIGILHSLDGMRRSEAYWHVRELVQGLRDVKESAVQFLKAGDAEAALTILLVLIEETSEGMELIDDSDGIYSCFIVELAEPLAKATRRANLGAYGRARLVRRLAKVENYLRGYEMDDIVEEAIRRLRLTTINNVARQNENASETTQLGEYPGAELPMRQSSFDKSKRRNRRTVG